MGLFTKKTIDRDFTGCELYKTKDEFKIYYPQTQEKIEKFLEIIKRADIKDNEIALNGEDLVCDMFELLTNVNVDECIRGKERLSIKILTVSNYIKKVVADTIELVISEDEANKSLEMLGINKSQEKETKKTNRNDKEVILEQWKEKEIERKESQKEEIVEQELPQVEDLDVEIERLEKELKEKKRQELLKQLAELG